MNRFIRKILALRNSLYESSTTSCLKQSHIKPTHSQLHVIPNLASRMCKAFSSKGKNVISCFRARVFKYVQNYSNHTRLRRTLNILSLNSSQRTYEPFSLGQYQMMTVTFFTASGLYCSLRFMHSPYSVVEASTPTSAGRNFIADIVAKAGPAVVFIEIKGRHPVSGKRVTLANGSGFLVRSNGVILTNAHVVANKPKVSVKLHDGCTYEGTVTAVDPVCDLATVKIECEKQLPIIPLGKSSLVRPGEFVAAMGSPLSLHKTVTVGIVSSHLRSSKELGMGNKDLEYIQTDATIGLGNSGGPLVNMDGKAIGINTLKLTEGISFAIPTDYATELVEKADLLASKADANNKPNYLPNGKETNKRRYMGITMLPLTPTIIMELKDKIADFPDITGGVYIHKVVVSSPAYAGGLHAGDIIVDINGLKMESAVDVYKMVEKSDMLRITVIRGRYKEKFSVVTETL